MIINEIGVSNAERDIHTYKLFPTSIRINLLYKLRLANVGLDRSNPKKNQRELLKVE